MALVDKFSAKLAHIIVASLLSPILILPLVILYPLFLHPLSQIPGPRFAAICKVWHEYHARNGQMFNLGKDLPKLYSHVVRVGRSEIWFDSKATFTVIYSAESVP
jgi:hypothetical protein